MNILHICNGFCTSKVHSNLCRSLDSMVEKQTVYTYIDAAEKVGKNSFEGNHTNIIYDVILNRFVRKIYPMRIKWTYYHLKRKISPTDFNCVFATTLFSDGGVANLIYKKYGIPYIVAVRTTDLTTYLKTRLFWKYGREILLNASRIVLINKAYGDRLKTLKFSRGIWDQIRDKIVIRPNGIDSFWIENQRRDMPQNKHSICYVGTFLTRKKVPQLIRAIESLLPEFPDLKLDIVGANGDTEQEIKILSKEKSFINFYGPVYDKQRLLDIYRNNGIFAMPSVSETFGLVYIEALSQNLRLLYTKGTGIDGMLDNVGVAVENPNEVSIREGLRELLLSYDEIDGNSYVDMSSFHWNNIAEEYIEMFKCLNKQFNYI